MRTRRFFAAALACSALQLLSVQAYLLPYTPSRMGQCHKPEKEYYEETVHKCCSLCPPGSRVFQSCNDTADTQCSSCEEGMFTVAWSRTTRCFSCSAQCREGFVEEKKCTRTQNRVCWCPPEHFCETLVSEICFRCQPYRKCEKGYGVAQAGTRTTDVDCAPCKPGTFSDLPSHEAVCRPHGNCKPVLIPGNSTSDTICHNPRQHIGLTTTSPPITKRLPSPVVTRSPRFSIKEDPSVDISVIAGWVASMTAVGVLVGMVACFVAFRKNSQGDAFPWGKKKQPFPCAEKLPGKWPYGAGTREPEKDNLLQSSASSSLDSPPGSDKSSLLSNGGASKVEAENAQERPPSLNGCTHYSRTDSKISESGKTHVNVSCVVSICNSGHNLPFKAPNGSVPTDPSDHAGAEEVLPMSQEESPMKREPERQIAVEVEDGTDLFYPSEGKPLPLSLQDAGMKKS